MNSNRFLLRTMFVIAFRLISIGSSGQGEHPDIQVQVTSDPFKMVTERSWNAHIAIRANRLGIAIRPEYQYLQDSTEHFVTDFERSSLGFEAAVHFPLHFLRPIGEHRTAMPCPSWGPVKRKSRANPKVLCVNGSIRLSLGYRLEQMEFLLQPASGQDPALGERAYRIKNNGCTAGIAYTLQIWRLAIEAGCHAFMSFPEADGSLEAFGSRLYTSKRPFKHRLQFEPDLRVGINIPISKP